MVLAMHLVTLFRHGVVSTLALREEQELPRHPWVGPLALGCCAGACKLWTRPSGKGALTKENEHQLLPVSRESPARQRHSPLGRGRLFSLLSSWDGQD